MDAARIEAVRQDAKNTPAVAQMVIVLGKIGTDGIRALRPDEANALKDAQVAAGLILFDQAREG